MGKWVGVAGDLLCCLDTTDSKRLENSSQFELGFGGNGAALAVSLARLGLESVLVSRVSQNLLGDRAIKHLGGLGVATQYILAGNGRMPLVFREQAMGWHLSRWLWDADCTTLSLLSPHDFVWNRMLRDLGWFHWSGALPAFGDKPAATVLAALRAARELRIPVSCDLDWPEGLWPDRLAREVLTPLLSYTDIIVTSPRCLKLFSQGRQREQLRILASRHGCKMAVLYLEEAQGDRVSLAGLLWDCTAYYTARPLATTWGRGGLQAFTGGLIYSILNKEGPREALDLAMAAAALKMSDAGDLSLAASWEVRELRQRLAAARLIQSYESS